VASGFTGSINERHRSGEDVREGGGLDHGLDFAVAGLGTDQNPLDLEVAGCTYSSPFTSVSV
jgi:hypothetical protein